MFKHCGVHEFEVAGETARTSSLFPVNLFHPCGHCDEEWKFFAEPPMVVAHDPDDKFRKRSLFPTRNHTDLAPLAIDLSKHRLRGQNGFVTSNQEQTIYMAAEIEEETLKNPGSRRLLHGKLGERRLSGQHY